MIWLRRVSLSQLQAFSQMGIQVSCGRSLIEENHFIFHMLPYEFFIGAGPMAYFGRPLFKILAKSLVNYHMKEISSS